jgi:hypothetical protein
VHIVARPLAPDETDYELITLSVSLGFLSLAIGWFAMHLPWPICAFHALTGHPCATCGATRSAIAFFHAQFLTAWKWNPLAFLAYCALSVFNVYAFAVLVLRRRRLRVTNLTENQRNVTRIAILASIALNWVYLLLANPSL